MSELTEEQRKELAAKIGVCDAFLAKTIGHLTIENKVKYLLSNFFYDEGWSSHTNPKARKDGFNCEHTYNDNSIEHFIEDFTRWIKHEWSKSFMEAIEEAQEGKES